MSECSYIYLEKYSTGEPYWSDEDIVLMTFEAEYGNGIVSLKDRLDFANKLSKDGKFTKEFILNVLKNKKN